jgi:hypothetical protein
MSWDTNLLPSTIIPLILLGLVWSSSPHAIAAIEAMPHHKSFSMQRKQVLNDVFLMSHQNTVASVTLIPDKLSITEQVLFQHLL